jgi:DNA-binding transcriptional LysR family regulator
MRDDFTGVAALLSVADKRSFTKAAKDLAVTPSAISQSIRNLEERVGLRLLQRTTRSVGLTEAGETFVERMRPALLGMHDAFESLTSLRDRPSGLLRLNVPRVVYVDLIGPRLAEFLRMYPEIKIEICIDQALADIVGQRFDAGIRLGQTLDPEMIAVRVSEDQRTIVVGSPTYFAKHGKPKHPRDLHQHACITYRQLSNGGIYRWEFSELGKDFEIAVDGRIIVNDAELMVDAALQGLGLAHVFESNVHDLVAKKKLVRVLDAFCDPFPGFFLYYPSRANIAPKLQAFVDFMKIKKPRRRS